MTRVLCVSVFMKTTDGRQRGISVLSLLEVHTSELTVSFHLEKSVPDTIIFS